MNDLTGQTIGRYHILEQIGEGGMAVVYKAYDTRLEREVAIKIIRKEAFPAEIHARIFKRFEREAKALAKLSHPNIIKYLDYGEFENSPYLVMEYHPGGTLKTLLGKPLDWIEVTRLVLPIARALGYAHEKRILHRDVKPSNILITEKGESMLTDFGIAKILDINEGQTLTGTGLGVGTPEYMAPEQGLGKEADARADIYSLGVILYELVTGRKPYTADTPMAVIFKHMTDPLPRPTDVLPGLSKGIEKLLLKALAKDPANRYQSMEELAVAIGKVSIGREKKSTDFLSSIPFVVNRPEKTVNKIEPINGLNNSITNLRQKQIPKKTWGWIGAVLLVLVTSVIIRVSQGAGKLSPTIQLNSGVAQIQETVTVTPTIAEMKSTEVPSVIHTHTQQPTDTPSPTPIPTQMSGIGSTQISPKDSMVMVYVPEGDFIMGSENFSNIEKPAHSVFLSSFWIDQTEVTNAQYQKCMDDGGCTVNQGYDSRFNGDQKPVVGVDWNQAKAYCEWAGRQLPSEAQWEKAARGENGQDYPWGKDKGNVKVNTGDILGHPSDVGSYVNDKSPYLAYDMAGNVSEWVMDWYDETYYFSQTKWNNPTGPVDGSLRVTRGGSWSYWNQNVNSSYRHGDLPSQQNNALGFRCAQNVAEDNTNTYLIPNVKPTSNAKSLPEYGISSTQISSIDGMVMVYVPAGDFIMGSDIGDSDEKPVHTVYLDAFWIDQTEVTNAMYQLCVNAGKCSKQTYMGSRYDGDLQPVVGVDWNQANKYCIWAGRQLPTEAQWEKAARGTDAREFPWGNGIDITKANYLGDVGKTTDVGSYRDGSSPYGVLDMAGNVAEWVADWYNESYYSIQTDWSNPNGPDSGKKRVFRGGSFFSIDLFHISNRASLYPDRMSEYIGVRCTSTSS